MTTTDLGNSYCLTFRSNLCSWNQLFVHLLLHTNATAHSVHSPLLSISLNWTEMQTDINSPTHWLQWLTEQCFSIQLSTLHWNEVNWTEKRWFMKSLAAMTSSGSREPHTYFLRRVSRKEVLCEFSTDLSLSRPLTGFPNVPDGGGGSTFSLNEARACLAPRPHRGPFLR